MFAGQRPVDKWEGHRVSTEYCPLCWLLQNLAVLGLTLHGLRFLFAIQAELLSLIVLTYSANEETKWTNEFTLFTLAQGRYAKWLSHKTASQSLFGTPEIIRRT